MHLATSLFRSSLLTFLVSCPLPPTRHRPPFRKIIVYALVPLPTVWEGDEGVTRYSVVYRMASY